MRKKDLLNDPEIKKISVENIGSIDMSNVKQIDGFTDKHGKYKGYTGSVILLVILCLLVMASVYFCMNYKVVQGNVVGKVGEVAGFSIIDNNYEPDSFLKEGAIIYYNGEENLINMKNDFDVGTISRANEGKYFIDTGLKETWVNRSQIVFVLAPDNQGDTQASEEIPTETEQQSASE